MPKHCSYLFTSIAVTELTANFLGAMIRLKMHLNIKTNKNWQMQANNDIMRRIELAYKC